MGKALDLLKYAEKTGDMRVIMDPENNQTIACLGGIVLGNDGLRAEVSALLGALLALPDLSAQIRADLVKRDMPLAIDDDGTLLVMGD